MNGKRFIFLFLGGCVVFTVALFYFQNYAYYDLTDIRQNIFNMKHPKKTLVKSTNEWHFENIVYKHQVRNIQLNNIE